MEMLRQISVAANQLCGIDQQESTDFCLSGSMREHVLICHGCGFIYSPLYAVNNSKTLGIFNCQMGITFLQKMSCLKRPLESSACAERELGEGPFTSGSPAVFACHLPYALVIETCSNKNLRVWLSIPDEKQWATWKQLIQVFGDSVMSKGTSAAWKIYDCPF